MSTGTTPPDPDDIGKHLNDLYRVADLSKVFADMSKVADVNKMLFSMPKTIDVRKLFGDYAKVNRVIADVAKPADFSNVFLDMPKAADLLKTWTDVPAVADLNKLLAPLPKGAELGDLITGIQLPDVNAMFSGIDLTATQVSWLARFATEGVPSVVDAVSDFQDAIDDDETVPMGNWLRSLKPQVRLSVLAATAALLVPLFLYFEAQHGVAVSDQTQLLLDILVGWIALLAAIVNEP